MTTATPKAKLNSAMQAVAAKAKAARIAATDVINVAYDGIQAAEWEEERRESAMSALLRMIRSTFARDHKKLDGKRALITQHAKQLPSDIVKACNALDRDADMKAEESVIAKEEKAREIARKEAKKAEQERIRQAAQGNDDADAPPPSRKAVKDAKKAIAEAAKRGTLTLKDAQAAIARAA